MTTSLKADDPLITVVTRNQELLAGKRLLVMGDIPSLQLLNTLIPTKQALVLC